MDSGTWTLGHGYYIPMPDGPGLSALVSQDALAMP